MEFEIKTAKSARFTVSTKSDIYVVEAELSVEDGVVQNASSGVIKRDENVIASFDYYGGLNINYTALDDNVTPITNIILEFIKNTRETTWQVEVAN
jgi:hypothetical protein